MLLYQILDKIKIMCYAIITMIYTAIYYVSKNGKIPERLTHDISARTTQEARIKFYDIICNPHDKKKWDVSFSKNTVILYDKINKIKHEFSDVTIKIPIKEG